MTPPPGNEEIVREGFRAFSEGRFEDALETMDPEIEWHVAFRLPDLPPERTVVHGHQEVLDLWRQFAGVWDRLVFEPEQILYDLDDTVIVRIRVQGTGSESHVQVDRTLVYVLTIRKQKLLRIVPFDSVEEAAEAAGVELSALR
jgi:ketosteroid isomerase-like protein